jgi:hypothetical protein
VRIASFNVENLFQRARAFEAADSDAGREVLALQSQINGILGQPAYSNADKSEIVSLLGRLGLATSDDGSPFVILRQNRGRLLMRHVGGEIEVTAGGRDDWLGWVELKVGPVNALSTRHTAQVVKDLAPDVLATVEVEDRLTLKGFSDILLPAVGGTSYGHAMVIDGNDDRGIDVGVLVRDGLEIVSMRSHVDDIDAKGEVFSRDCAEYLIEGPAGSRVRVLVTTTRSVGARRSASPRSTRRHVERERSTSPSSATSTTRPTPRRSGRCSRPPTCRTSPRAPTSPAMGAQARSATARRARSSTTSCSRRSSSMPRRAVESSAKVCGAARTAPSGSTIPT